MSEPAADAQRRMWTGGDYPTIARHLLPISVETIAAIGLRPGDRVLDVGVGTGNAAIEASRRGARVTGIDLTPAQIERAQTRCADEGVVVDLRVGDVASLEVADSTFDVVVSVMGMIFAPDHSRAISEMARVCRPGGTVAITAWTTGGWSRRCRDRVSHLLPAAPPGAPSPDEWGDADEVQRRFAAAGLVASVVERPFAFSFSSVDAALETLLNAAGPFVQMMEAAAALGSADEVRRQVLAVVAESNTALDGSCVLPAPYLLAIGRR